MVIFRPERRKMRVQESEKTKRIKVKGNKDKTGKRASQDWEQWTDCTRERAEGLAKSQFPNRN